MPIMKSAVLVILNLFALSLYAGETFTPYEDRGDVPRNASDLWSGHDATRERQCLAGVLTRLGSLSRRIRFSAYRYST